LKKIYYFVALLIAFMLALAAPSAAMADVETGWAVLHKNYEASAVLAEPAALNLKQSGVKDTVLGVYAVLPLMGKSVAGDKSAPSAIAKASGKTVVVSYKDRPGWLAH
jgi:hypothetical protein